MGLSLSAFRFEYVTKSSGNLKFNGLVQNLHLSAMRSIHSTCQVVLSPIVCLPCRLAASSAPMVGVAMLRCLAAAAILVAVAHGQTVGSALTGQSGASFPGACPISKLSDVIVTTIATLPESTTGPITVMPRPM